MSEFIATVDGGVRLEILKALRGELATAIREASPGVLAPLSKQLLEVLAQIDELSPQEVKGTPLDELEQWDSGEEPGSEGVVVAISRGRQRSG